MEIQRQKLLRLVAGLLVAVAFVSAGPFSCAVAAWVSSVVSSVLSRAEAAAQCLVIVQARIIAARTGSAVNACLTLVSAMMRDARTRVRFSRCATG
jgi:hypothetical protein